MTDYVTDDMQLKAIKVPEGQKQKRQPVGDGLYLLIRPTSRSWRWDFRLAGKRDTVSLGSYPSTSLKQAKRRLAAAKALQRRGINPRVHQQEERAANIAAQQTVEAQQVEDANTFKAVSLRWLAKQKAEWAVSYYQKQVSRLNRHIIPAIGDTPVKQIARQQVADFLRVLANTGRRETAKRCGQIVRCVFDYALNAGLVDGNPVGNLNGDTAQEELLKATEQVAPGAEQASGVNQVSQIVGRVDEQQAITDGAKIQAGGGVLIQRLSVLQDILDYLPCGLTVFDADLEMVAYNSRLLELLDFPESLFAEGLPSMEKLVHFNALRGDYGEGDADALTATVIDRAKKMQPHAFERTRPNGNVLEIRGTPLPDGGFVSTYTDITDRKHAENALRESEAELHLLIDNVPAMVLYLDPSLYCSFANKRYAEFFGMNATDLIGMHISEIVGDAAFITIQDYFNKALAGESCKYQRLVQLNSGDQRWIDANIVPYKPGQKRTTGIYITVLDITEQKQATEKIQYQAQHDPLTGLPNRLLLNEELTRMLESARCESTRLALVFLDLDRFKDVNDTLGHHAGDQILINVAKRMRRGLRDCDMVARIGGDEFTIILQDIRSREIINAIVNKVMKTITSPFQIKEYTKNIFIGASIGIAIYPDDTQDLESLFRNADAAMYEAKKHGSCIRFYNA